MVNRGPDRSCNQETADLVILVGWTTSAYQLRRHGPKPPRRRYELMASSLPHKRTTVLIVEDEAVLRLELESRLAEMGLIVLTAEGADVAIGLLEAHPEISVLFTDIRMAGSIDGVRLAHQACRRWPPIRIIVTSGLTAVDLASLPDDSIFLQKPYPPEDLAGALTAMIGGSRPHTTGGRLQARA
jgi:DNA-binding NtrC family response regulator